MQGFAKPGGRGVKMVDRDNDQPKRTNRNAGRVKPERGMLMYDKLLRCQRDRHRGRSRLLVECIIPEEHHPWYDAVFSG